MLADDPFADLPAPSDAPHFGPPPGWEEEMPPYGEEGEHIDPIRATPFVWRAEADIPPRQWLYGTHLLRKFLSVDVAAGGIGKSSVKIGEALAMTSNRAIYNKAVFEGPLRVWLYNLEDPAEETERRIHATAKHFCIMPEDIGDRLYVDSGRKQRCVIAEERASGAMIIRPIVDSIIDEIRKRRIDVLIIDPFVSSHSLNENDNRAMDLVAKEWGRVADICNCSINLVHHVRKGNGAEATADSARGAKSLTDAARSVIVFNRMTPEEAEAAGVAPENIGFHFRTANDKANLAPPERADWFRMNNVDLANGDKVGVACPFEWPDTFAGISVDKLRRVQKAVSEGSWRQDVRAENWVGTIVSTVLDMDPERDRKRLTKIIKEWLKTGVLAIVEREDAKRMPRQFVEVGKWVTE